MKNFFKDNKVILILLLFVGLLLRLWNLNKPEGLWNDEYVAYSISMLKFKEGFFEAIKSNCHAPLHYFYLKLWMKIFRNSDFMLRLSSLIPNLLGCLVIYHAGKNYITKDSSEKIAQACLALSVFSSFLIYFSQEVRIYSMIFLLSSLILLFSLKMHNSPSKKYGWWIVFLSILLILEHTIGFIFVIFNIFALLAFKQHQKKQKEKDYFTPMLSGLILCIPIIPFLFRIFAHPTYFSQWWAPFNWSKIFFYFTDLFSPILKNLVNSPNSFYSCAISNNHINFKFVLFGLIPSMICLFLIIKSNLDSKKINKYLLSVFLATFLTVLIASISGQLAFLTKYLTELYPILILMCAIGWAQLNSQNNRIILATIYLFMSISYIIFSHINSIRLLIS